MSDSFVNTSKRQNELLTELENRFFEKITSQEGDIACPTSEMMQQVRVAFNSTAKARQLMLEILFEYKTAVSSLNAVPSPEKTKDMSPLLNVVPIENMPPMKDSSAPPQSETSETPVPECVSPGLGCVAGKSEPADEIPPPLPLVSDQKADNNISSHKTVINALQNMPPLQQGFSSALKQKFASVNADKDKAPTDKLEKKPATADCEPLSVNADKDEAPTDKPEKEPATGDCEPLSVNADKDEDPTGKLEKKPATADCEPLSVNADKDEEPATADYEPLAEGGPTDW